MTKHSVKPQDFEKELYISVDVETDGPCPGIHSMLSFGAAAYTVDKKIVGTFTRNLHKLDGCVEDPDTMKWWDTQPEAWSRCRRSPQLAIEAMEAFDVWLNWITEGHNNMILVAAPLMFDGAWINYYLHRFVGKSKFGYSGLDLQSWVSGYRKVPYYKSGKKFMPRRWFNPDLVHNHCALDDAIEQGDLFITALRDSLGLKQTR